MAIYLMVIIIYLIQSKKSMASITKEITIQELVEKYPEAVPIMLEAGLHCIGCMASQFETFGQGCEAHGINADELVEKINVLIKDKE